jgi:hypothetical protein
MTEAMFGGRVPSYSCDPDVHDALEAADFQPRDLYEGCATAMPARAAPRVALSHSTRLSCACAREL